MLRRSREIWYALLAVILVTALYLWVVSRRGAVPAASNLFGHGLGILGVLLMLMTETLYSLRKRSRLARWGSMSSWLRFHIFTGLVGPYMVLLHTSWKFHGLAAVAMVLTIVVVVSGVVGRYLYTAVPRTADGAELQAEELERQIAAIEAELQGVADGPPGPADRVRPGRAGAQERDAQLARRQALQRQMASLATARRALATWHTVHIPLGVVLFAAAFVHSGAAIYYATLLR